MWAQAKYVKRVGWGSFVSHIDQSFGCITARVIVKLGIPEAHPSVLRILGLDIMGLLQSTRSSEACEQRDGMGPDHDEYVDEGS